ncbi:hypothetical protein CPC08DRAFT_780199 [Agrocybe pediades]|nr:hypothetical protein CPC08DRAFT_780199 [Agrocybe pediades]
MSHLSGPAVDAPLPDNYVIPKQDFEAFLRFVAAVKKSIRTRNKFPIDEALTDRGEQSPMPPSYLDDLVAHWTRVGAIPKDLIPGGPPNVTPTFETRILRSLAYSLQHPKITLLDLEPRQVLERFIDRHAEIFGKRKSIPYSAFSVVVTEVDEIPDHYGHSAYPWKDDLQRRYTAAEQILERGYRRALAFPHLEGACPAREPGSEDAKHTTDTCGEYIAFPYVIDFVKRYLGDGSSGKTLVIKSLTLSPNKKPKRFCPHCIVYVRRLVSEYTGLSVIDLATGIVYESNANNWTLPDTLKGKDSN